jgi:hypothetical protein
MLEQTGESLGMIGHIDKTPILYPLGSYFGMVLGLFHHKL